jgi:hypothetical protein
MGPSVTFQPYSSAYKFPNIPKPTEASTKNNSGRRKFQKHQIPSWGIF